MNLNELRQRLNELENFIDSSKDLQRALIDDPRLLTEKFKEENQSRITQFFEAKKEIREIKKKLMNPKEKREYEDYLVRLKDKYSDD
jgi:hypothetical protein